MTRVTLHGVVYLDMAPFLEPFLHPWLCFLTPETLEDGHRPSTVQMLIGVVAKTNFGQGSRDKPFPHSANRKTLVESQLTQENQFMSHFLANFDLVTPRSGGVGNDG